MNIFQQLFQMAEFCMTALEHYNCWAQTLHKLQ